MSELQEALQAMRRRVQSADAQSAFDALIEGLTDTGFEIRWPRKGFLRSVNFWKGRWYPVAFIPNTGDLLFYLRNPLLKLNPTLHRLALEHHAGRVNVNPRGEVMENAAKETKIRIANADEAKRLLTWLLPWLTSHVADGAV